MRACSTIDDYLIRQLRRENVTAYTSPRRGVTEFWVVNATDVEVRTIIHDLGVGVSTTTLLSPLVHKYI